MKQIKPYQALILSVLILTGTACKKNLPDSVTLASSPKGVIQLGDNYGRLIAYDDDDGTGLSNIINYDVNTGIVSCDHISGGTITPVWSRTGIFLDNAPALSVSTYMQVTDPYNEVGGMHLIAYDATGSGHQDWLIAYNPGQRYFALLQPNFSLGAGVFHLVYSNNNIGGYDLASVYDKIITFELNGTSKTALICYRPGGGNCWVIQNQGTATSPNFVGVFKSSSGIAGYDLKGTSDQLVAVDDNPGLGNSDLIAYRPGPGLGYVWYITHTSNSTVFTATYTSHSGLPNFPCNHLGDRIIAFDLNGSGWQNYLLCYSPGNPGATVADAVSGSVASGSPFNSSSGFTYPMNLDPYSNGYVGDKILAFEGNGSSWGYSTLLGYQNGTNVDQIFDMTQHGVNPNGTWSFARVY